MIDPLLCCEDFDMPHISLIMLVIYNQREGISEKENIFISIIFETKVYI